MNQTNTISMSTSSSLSQFNIVDHHPKTKLQNTKNKTIPHSLSWSILSVLTLNYMTTPNYIFNQDSNLENAHHSTNKNM